MKTRNDRSFTRVALFCLFSVCVSIADESRNQIEEVDTLSKGARSLGIVITGRDDKGIALMNRIAEEFPDLEELHMDYLPYGAVPESVIDNIITLDSLGSLSFSGDLIFTPEQLSRIAKKPKLRHLSFACP